MRRIALSLALAAILLTSAAAAAQTAQPPAAASTAATPAAVPSAQPAPAANLTFDVATIRPSAPLDPVKLQADMKAGHMPAFGPHVDASRATYNYMSLKDLIGIAYSVKAYQITGPDWLGTQRFDVTAKLPDGATKDDAPAMLQALLKDRFNLVAHLDSQEHSVLALVVGKNGPKLKDAPPATPLDPDAPLKSGEIKMDTADGPARMTRGADGTTTINMGEKGTYVMRMDGQSQMMHMDASTITMSGFADLLTNLTQMGGTGGQQIVDMTNLKGNYQVSVDISLADVIAFQRAQNAGATSTPAGPDAAALPADPSGGGATVAESVQKLGLKLEPRKTKITQLIVDRADKSPTEN
jgi:uncharacterized protein (TIGR03435 family)